MQGKTIPLCCGEKLLLFKANIKMIIDGKKTRALNKYPIRSRSSEEYGYRNGYIQALNEMYDTLDKCKIETDEKGDMVYSDTLPGCLYEI